MAEATTILIADDDLGMRESAARALRREGFHVLTAEDGTAALETLRRECVALLVADLRMPGLDGLELLRAAKLVAPQTEVIVISGHGTVEEAVEAMKAGAYDFLTKPFDRAALIRGARQALERRALILENRSPSGGSTSWRAPGSWWARARRSARSSRSSSRSRRPRRPS